MIAGAETTRPPAGRRRRWLDFLCWAAVAPPAVWTALRLTGWDVGFRWVQLVAFTPYVAAAALVVAVTALLLRRKAAAAAGWAVALLLALAVLPRALADGGPVVDGPRLRVLAVNLAMGAADRDSLVELVRAERPDVLALQEITPAAAGSLDTAGLRKLLPNRTEELIRPGVGGSAVYSRFPLRELDGLDLGEFGQARALISIPGGPRVEVTSVHPCAPRFAARHACWEDGLRALPRERDVLRVLAGDFNATLDHVPVRDLLADGYRDAADVTGEGLTATWPMSSWGPLPGVTLDHILADDRIAVTAFRTHLLPATDHKATFAELRLP